MTNEGGKSQCTSDFGQEVVWKLPGVPLPVIAVFYFLLCHLNPVQRKTPASLRGISFSSLG